MEFLTPDTDLGFLDESTTTSGKCSLKSAVLNTARLKRAGFKVIDRGNGTFKVKPVKKSLRAKLMGFGGSNFIKKVIMECVDKECELQNPAEENLWEVKQLTDGTFLIVRKGGNQ